MNKILSIISLAALSLGLLSSCKKDEPTGDYTPTEADYVEIAAKYDGSSVTTLKWLRQNLAINGSGKKGWRGGNASAVKVPGTDKDVIVGDYFQWAAHEGYCESGDRGLLIYNSFSNRACGDNMDHFAFKNVGEYMNSYQFNTAGRRSTVGISPYYVNGYTKYNSIDKRKTLEASDDVARIILGGSWRMPSSAEFQAMKDATYWAWDAKDGGYYVYTPQEGDAGKTDEGAAHTYDKSKALLFFPAAGNGFNTYLDGAGSNGRYWSSTLSDPVAPTRAQSLCFSANDVSPQNGNDRYLGYCVRPVSN